MPVSNKQEHIYLINRKNQLVLILEFKQIWYLTEHTKYICTELFFSPVRCHHRHLYQIQYHLVSAETCN